MSSKSWVTFFVIVPLASVLVALSSSVLGGILWQSTVATTCATGALIISLAGAGVPLIRGVPSKLVVALSGSAAILASCLLAFDLFILPGVIDSGRQLYSRKTLVQLANALNSYRVEHGAFPDIAIRDEHGHPLLSWRVAILPYLGQRDLYEEFHLDEPWNSIHNIELLLRLPRVYNMIDASTARRGETYYQRVVLHLTDHMELDVSCQNIVIVEDLRAIPWTRPIDLEIDADWTVQLGGIHRDGFYAAWSDASVWWIPKNAKQDEIRSKVIPVLAKEERGQE